MHNCIHYAFTQYFYSQYDSSTYLPTTPSISVVLVTQCWCLNQRENIDTEAVSTDGRATLYANGQTHMFERKVVIKKQMGGFKYKKNKSIYFFFTLPETVFEHVYISTLPHSCTVVKQYKELTTKILSRTFLILSFLTIN
jgi:hypothetical protein